MGQGRPVPSKHVGVEAGPSCPGCAAAALQRIIYIQGLYRGYIGVIQGLYRESIRVIIGVI